MAQMLNQSCKVRESEIQPYYYVPFQTNTLEKIMNPFILPGIS